MKIGVVSPWMLTRKALSCRLETDKDLSVGLELDHALEGYDRIRNARPEILLIDCISPENDLEGVSRPRKLFPDIKIVLLREALVEFNVTG